MAGKLTFSEEGANALKLQLIQTATLLAEVANGAYVSDTMFTESKSPAADAMDEVLPVLAQCATDMYTCCESMAHFFQRVIEKFEEWDYNMAVKSYMLGTMNTMDPLKQLPTPIKPGDAGDDWAYQQGLNQGLGGQINNVNPDDMP